MAILVNSEAVYVQMCMHLIALPGVCGVVWCGKMAHIGHFLSYLVNKIKGIQIEAVCYSVAVAHYCMAYGAYIIAPFPPRPSMKLEAFYVTLLSKQSRQLGQTMLPTLVYCVVGLLAKSGQFLYPTSLLAN